mmetsp:Transcript_18835/g.27293  ORF Transcript_18835/g.27293 Transcript_18835/m.27293 type:complete len:201 (-) Transcript_18835:530-1132(-)
MTMLRRKITKKNITLIKIFFICTLLCIGIKIKAKFTKSINSFLCQVRWLSFFEKLVLLTLPAHKITKLIFLRHRQFPFVHLAMTIFCMKTGEKLIAVLPILHFSGHTLTLLFELARKVRFPYKTQFFQFSNALWRHIGCFTILIELIFSSTSMYPVRKTLVWLVIKWHRTMPILLFVFLELLYSIFPSLIVHIPYKSNFV